MLKWIKHFVVTLMAVVVLCSTLSFSVHKHFCGPFLKDISVIVPSHGCGMDVMESEDLCAISVEKSCCNDIVELIKGQDNLKISTLTFDFDQQEFFIAFAYSYVSIFRGEDIEDLSFKAYSPPLVIRDLPILHQSFLI